MYSLQHTEKAEGAGTRKQQQQQPHPCLQLQAHYSKLDHHACWGAGLVAQKKHMAAYATCLSALAICTAEDRIPFICMQTRMSFSASLDLIMCDWSTCWNVETTASDRHGRPKSPVMMPSRSSSLTRPAETPHNLFQEGLMRQQATQRCCSQKA